MSRSVRAQILEHGTNKNTTIRKTLSILVPRPTEGIGNRDELT